MAKQNQIPIESWPNESTIAAISREINIKQKPMDLVTCGDFSENSFTGLGGDQRSHAIWELCRKWDCRTWDYNYPYKELARFMRKRTRALKNMMCLRKDNLFRMFNSNRLVLYHYVLSKSREESRWLVLFFKTENKQTRRDLWSLLSAPNSYPFGAENEKKITCWDFP